MKFAQNYFTNENTCNIPDIISNSKYIEKSIFKIVHKTKNLFLKLLCTYSLLEII
jgi:hypothetical protein